MQKSKMNKEKQDKYLNRFYKLYPILKGFTDDLLFFVAIDTLFLTLVKGLSAQEIVLLTTISSIISILFRVQLIKIIRKIGNTKSVRLGMGLLLLSSILITLGPSYIWIIVGKTLYEIAFVFKDMENVMLQNNLAVKGKTADYVKISNKSTVAYSFITMILAVRDPYKLYINDIALKLSKPEEQQVVFAYVQYGRKIGVTIFSLIISAALIELEMVYIIIGTGLLAFIEIILTIKLYRMLKSNINEKQEVEYVLTCSNRYDKEYTK